MRIVIDLQGAQGNSRHRGIGRYSLSLAQAMARNRGEHEIFIVLNSMLPESMDAIFEAFEGILPSENIKIWNAVAPVHAFDKNNQWRISSGELLREAFIASLRPDVVHISSFFDGWGDNVLCSINRFPSGVPIAVTYYDAIPLMQSEVYLSDKDYRKFYLDKTENIKQASLFLAISESAKSECVQYLEQSPDKIVNIAAAVDDKFQPISMTKQAEEGLKKKFRIMRGFIMYSGATDERKNHLRLIRAYASLPQDLRRGYQLVFVGGLPKEHKEKFQAYAKICNLEAGDLVITDRVSDLELVQLYNTCDLFVFPSMHEGFGLPALEAMSCGAATIGANTTSVPEVIGREDALFNPFDVNDIASKITQVLTDDAFKASLRQHGLEQAKRFSWDASANKALRAIEALLQSSNPLFDKENNWQEQVLGKIGEINVAKPLKDQDLLFLSDAVNRNFRNGNKRLFVDVTELAKYDNASGIQRVVKNIVKSLIEQSSLGYEVKLVHILPNESQFRYANEFCAKNFGMKQDYDRLIDFASEDVFLGLDLNFIQDREFIINELKYSGVKVYFVVYDILPIIMPQYFVDGIGDSFKPWLKCISNSDGLICISKSVADEVIDILPFINKDRKRALPVGWFHLGADLSSSMASSGLPDGSNELIVRLKSRSTFLMVGTLEPRKGHMEVLQEFEKLWLTGIDINLVIVGKRGWFVDLLADLIKAHQEHGSRLFWLEKASDEYLDLIYGASDCLIAASYGEGFGLPLIEAAQKGIPLIVRDIPVFREVAGNSATYFDSNHTSLSEVVRGWLHAKANGQITSSQTMSWITWKESADQLMKNILHQSWYDKWQPQENMRCWFASDGVFGSLVGKREGIRIETDSREGVLLYGPYVALESARKYHIELTFSKAVFLNNEAKCSISITADSGKIQLLSGTYSNLDLTQHFEIISPIEGLENVEVVIWVNEYVKMAIDKVVIIDVGEVELHEETSVISYESPDVNTYEAIKEAKPTNSKQVNLSLIEKFSKWLMKRN